MEENKPRNYIQLPINLDLPEISVWIFLYNRKDENNNVTVSRPTILNHINPVFTVNAKRLREIIYKFKVGGYLEVIDGGVWGKATTYKLILE